MKLQEINVADIKIKFNHREVGDISGLMNSIKAKGLLTPISVIKNKGKYFLIDGERRLTAVKKLKHTKVEAYIKEEDEITEDKEFLILQVLQNEARKSLSVFERQLAYSKLVEAEYTPEEIAVALDTPVRQVKEILTLTKYLPNSYMKDITYKKAGLGANEVGIGTARRVAKLAKDGKLNGPKLAKTWETLKKGKRKNVLKKETINNREKIVCKIRVPLKYKKMFSNTVEVSKAINSFLDSKLFHRYV